MLHVLCRYVAVCSNVSTVKNNTLPPLPLVPQIARDEKMSLQQQEHEARMQRALERASAPMFKKAGKPVMARSTPMKKKEVVQEDDGNDDEAELAAYLARDMI